VRVSNGWAVFRKSIKGMLMEEAVKLLLALVGGLGIGSMLTALVKEKFDKKKFLFQQKEQVYSGYLKALSDAVKNNSSEDMKQEVVYWTTRMKLIAPESVVEKAQEFFTDASSQHKFFKLREELIDLMRNDLKSNL